MAIWTANLKPRDLSRGFKPGKGLDDALNALAHEVPLGAVDLKKALEQSLATFEVKASRRCEVIYLGDGRSVAQPVDTRSAERLCELMVKKQAAYYAVPLGPRPDAQNLHGLVSGTGGQAVRYSTSQTPEQFVAKLKKAVAEPILYVEDHQLGAGMKDVMPSRIPPLRRDRATLLVGKLDKNATQVRCTLKGEADGKPVKEQVEQKVPAADEEFAFLESVVGQWKAARELRRCWKPIGRWPMPTSRISWPLPI